MLAARHDDDDDDIIRESISPKANVIAGQNSHLDYFEAAVQHFSHNAIRA